MKAVVWHGVGDIRLDEVPDPTVQDPTDAIVEIMEATSGFAGPGPALGYVTASVADLETARRYFGGAFGLEEIDPVAVHRTEHEALWGLDGARRTCAVFRAGAALIEVVQYASPAPRPPDPDALLAELSSAFELVDRGQAVPASGDLTEATSRALRSARPTGRTGRRPSSGCSSPRTR